MNKKPNKKCPHCSIDLKDRRNKTCKKCIDYSYRKGMKTPSRKGAKMSEEAKIKISIASRGRKHTKESKEKIRQWHIAHPNKKFKDTGIELQIEAELKKRNIQYEKQVPLCNIAVVDFYLPEYRIIIQCDGNYWHNYPEGREKDRQQDNILKFNGFNIYRFWESEINKSPKECINIIFN